MRHIVLEGLGAPGWDASFRENGRETASRMSSRFTELRRERARGDDRPNPRHEHCECRQHLPRQFAESSGRTRVLELNTGCGVHPISQGTRLRVIARNDREMLSVDAQRVKRIRCSGSR